MLDEMIKKVQQPHYARAFPKVIQAWIILCHYHQATPLTLISQSPSFPVVTTKTFPSSVLVTLCSYITLHSLAFLPLLHKPGNEQRSEEQAPSAMAHSPRSFQIRSGLRLVACHLPLQLLDDRMAQTACLLRTEVREEHEVVPCSP